MHDGKKELPEMHTQILEAISPPRLPIAAPRPLKRKKVAG